MIKCIKRELQIGFSMFGDEIILCHLWCAATKVVIVTASVLLADYVTTGNGQKNGAQCGL